jgi:outer membrane protein assembly factor BamB
MKQSNLLFILSNGRVAAVNKKDGNIVWEVKLREYLSSKMTLTIGQISVESNKIYVGSTGILLCLSTKDGSLIWKNELRGWGYNFVSLANANNEVASAAAMQAAAATTAIVAAT